MASKVDANRAQQIKYHSSKTNIVAPNFSAGDFVLVRRAQEKNHKMCFRWQCPHRITGVVSDLVYDVSNLTDTKTERVQCAQHKLYRPREEGSKVSEEMLLLAEHTEARFELVEKI